MKVFIANKDITKSIQESLIYDERLDQVLDSVQFTMSSEKSKNIAPFTDARIEWDNGTISYFFASSQAEQIVTGNDYYIHSVTFIEATKILECFILGSKAFSVVVGKSDYNTNYDRVKIICDLMSRKYSVNFESDAFSKLKEEREYQFGPGTTMFDALLEICKTENCIPKVTKVNDKIYTLGLVDIASLKNDRVGQKFSNYIKYIQNQNVDEYCSAIETEMSDVVDRSTIQKATLTCRSKSSTIYVDNACLITPGKIEEVKSLKIDLQNYPCQATPLFLIPKRYINDIIDLIDSSGKSQTGLGDAVITSLTLAPYDMGGYERFFMAKLNQYYPEVHAALNTWLDSKGITYSYLSNALQFNNNVSLNVMKLQTNIVDTPIDISVRNNYYLAYIYDKKGNKNASSAKFKSGVNLDVSDYVLPKERWDLLEARVQPHYVYFESGQNYIDGFNNYYNENFWEKIIYQETEPFIPFILGQSKYQDLEDFYEVANPAQYYTKMLGMHYDTMSDIGADISITSDMIVIDANNGDQVYGNDELPSYAQLIPKLKEKNGNDFTKFIYNVEYSAICPAYLSIDKSVRPDNEDTFKTTARSYNNGANTIDFDQLLPAMQRAVDMLGLEERQVTALDDFEVGTKTEYGYVISKQATYKVKNGQTYLLDIVYNLSPNYEQLAASVAVKTQYEATNVPKMGIIDRYVYLGALKFTSDETWESNKNSDIFMRIYRAKISQDSFLKLCTRLELGGQVYLVCEMVDNYTFDYQRASGNGDYYKNNPISFGDTDNTVENALVSLAKIKRLENASNVFDLLNKMPMVESGNYKDITISAFSYIYKDPRERLIFVAKVIQ